MKSVLMRFPADADTDLIEVSAVPQEGPGGLGGLKELLGPLGGAGPQERSWCVPAAGGA